MQQNQIQQEVIQQEAIVFQKESIIKLQNYTEKRVRVDFLGGRQVSGILKGFDVQNNMILDDCIEFLRDPNDSQKLSGKQRELGLIIIRGKQINYVINEEEYKEISNPY